MHPRSGQSSFDGAQSNFGINRSLGAPPGAFRYSPGMDGSIATKPARQGGWLAEARLTLALAWPLVLTNLSQFALSLTDALFLGHVGTEALAAATIGGNLYFAALAPAFAEWERTLDAATLRRIRDWRAN